MEFFIIVTVLASITLFLAYKYEVLDFYVYVVAVIAALIAMIFFFFFCAYHIALPLLGLSALCVGGFWLYRYVKHY